MCNAFSLFTINVLFLNADNKGPNWYNLQWPDVYKDNASVLFIVAQKW